MSVSDPLPSAIPTVASTASSATPVSAVVVEGEIKCATTSLIYPKIDSCMTLTFLLQDNTLLGVHCVQIPDGDQLGPPRLIEEALKVIQSKGIKEIIIMGDQGWSLTSFNPTQDDLSLAPAVALAIYFAKVFQTPHVTYADAHGDLSVHKDDRHTLTCQEKSEDLPLQSPWSDFLSYEDIDLFLSVSNEPGNGRFP